MSGTLDTLLRRARRHIMAQRLLDALPAGLATSAAGAVVCVGINDAFMSLHPALVWTVTVVPTALWLLRAVLQPAPALDEVACLVDRWLDTNELLTTAWHVQRRHAGPQSENARLVLRLAEAAAIEFGPALRHRPVSVSRLATASLIVLVATALPLSRTYDAARTEDVIPAPFMATRVAQAGSASLSKGVRSTESIGNSSEPRRAVRDMLQVAGDPPELHDLRATAPADVSIGSKTAGSGEAFAAAARLAIPIAPDAEKPAPGAATRTTRWVDVARTGRAGVGEHAVSPHATVSNADGISESGASAPNTGAAVTAGDTHSFALETYRGRYLEDSYDD